MLPKELLFFVINIGDVPYAKYTLPFLYRYCEKHGYPIFVLEKSLDKRVPPSWFKMLSHRICDSPFILCCDLDIFIVPDAPPIHEVIDQDKINVCLDGSYYEGKINLRHPLKHKVYKFNCGLIGFPKTKQSFMETIYKKSDITPDIFCWEQGCFNDVVDETQVNVLPIEWNSMTCYIKRTQNPDYQRHYFKHITCGPDYPAHRDVWAKAHFDYYTKLSGS